MLKCFYIVEKIDGDYAMLRRTDETDPAAEPKMVARALLPPEIREGSRLLYEYLQYSIVESITRKLGQHLAASNFKTHSRETE